MGCKQLFLLLVCCRITFNPAQSHVPICYVTAFGGPTGMGNEEGETASSSHSAGSGSGCVWDCAVSPSLGMLWW